MRVLYPLILLVVERSFATEGAIMRMQTPKYIHEARAAKTALGLLQILPLGSLFADTGLNTGTRQLVYQDKLLS